MIYNITHRDCPDGLACNFILKQFLGKIISIPTRPSCIVKILPKPGDTIFITDVVPKYLEIRPSNSYIIVDHHKSNFNELEKLKVFPNVKIIAKEGEGSAALLLWKLLCQKQPPRWLSLISESENDVFTSSIEAQAYYHGIKYLLNSEKFEHLVEISPDLVTLVGTKIFISYEYRFQEKLLWSRESLRFGYRVKQMFMTPALNSAVSYLKEHPELQGLEYVYSSDKKKKHFIVSNIFDCSEIANTFGGGGHKQFAVF